LLPFRPHKIKHSMSKSMSESETEAHPEPPIMVREGSTHADVAAGDRDAGNRDPTTEAATTPETLPPMPCKQLLSKPSVLDKYNLATSDFNTTPSPWMSILGTAISPYDLTPLVASLEFAANRRYVCEQSNKRSNAKRTFRCTHCQDFRLVFGRRTNSKKADPFFLRESSSTATHAPNCPRLDSIPSREILSNLPLFINFVRQQRRKGGKATFNTVETHLIAHNMSCRKLSKTTFHRAHQDVVAQLRLEIGDEYLKLPTCSHLREIVHVDDYSSSTGVHNMPSRDTTEELQAAAHRLSRMRQRSMTSRIAVKQQGGIIPRDVLRNRSLGQQLSLVS
jgi:hypothetical protein